MMDRCITKRWRWVLLGCLLVAGTMPGLPAEQDQKLLLDHLQELLEARKWAEAADQAQAVLDEDPDNGAVRAKLGLALMGKARTEDQILDEPKADSLKNATDPEAFFDPSLFKSEVNYDEGLWDQARQEFDRALTKAPDSLDARVGLASYYGRAGDPQKEREQIRLAAKAHAGDQDAGRLLLRFGEKYFSIGAYEDALAIFAILHETHPEDPTVALDLGAAQFANSQYDQGIQTLVAAAQRDPDNENLQQTLGQMYFFRMYWEEAAKLYRGLADKHPDDNMHKVHEGAALLPVSEERGKGMLKAVVDADPEKNSAGAAIAANLVLGLEQGAAPDLVRLADELNRRRMPHLAVSVGGVLLVREPDSVAGRLVFAAVYDGLQYFDLALFMLRDAEKVMAENPEGSAPFTRDDVVANVGRTHFRMGNYQLAIDSFLGAQNPQRFDFVLGLAYENLGDYKRAFGYFNKIVESSGGGEQAVAASEHLAKEVYAGFQTEP